MEPYLADVLAFRPNRLVPPFDLQGHIPFVAWLVRSLRPTSFVQLGTQSGNLYFAVCQTVAEQHLATRCWAVGTWQAEELARSDALPDVSGATEHNRQHYAGFSSLLRMGDAQALPRFAPASIDLLLIDGRYSPETVISEYESWRDRLSERGVLLLAGIGHPDSGAATLWQKLRHECPSLAFEHAQGMGVLLLGNAIPESIRKACMVWSAPEAQAQLQSIADMLMGARLQAGMQAQISSLSARLAESEAQCRRLGQENADLQQQAENDHVSERLAMTEQALADARAGQAASARRVAELEHLVRSLQESLCWRVTAPIRWVGTPINRTRHKMALVRRSIVLRGGAGKAASQAVRILRNEGVQGLQARISNAERMLQGPTGQQASLLQPGEDPYHGWLRLYDPTDADTMAALGQKIRDLGISTTFSVVMPVYNPPLDYLRQAIASVQAQVYPHWEICIADDASPNPSVREMLSELAAEDARIKLVFREKNGHISAATNSALEIATGDYIALMDNDDLLPPHALAHMALAIHQHPEAGLLYSDEDKVTEDNVRQAPYFKCQFNYELFLSQNMISHFGVYRRSVLQEIGGFRVGYEGAQDWDLALRVIEKVGAGNVVHVPRILYHWRIFPGSTALALEEKDYALKAQINSITSHLQRIGKPDTQVYPAPGIPGLLRIRHPLPDPLPLVSIIIPTRDRVELLSMCVDAILEKTAYQNYQIVVLDNGSTDEKALAYLQAIEKDEHVRVIRADMPFNYSALNNLGVAQAEGEYLVLMNNDIEITQSDWLEEMLAFACQPDIGCVGAQLWYPNNTLQHGGVVLGIGGVASHAHKGIPRGNFGYFGRASAHQMFSAVTAACLMIRKRVYLDVGGFDEELKVAYNDVDFCLKVRATGLRNLYNPFASFIHHESASRGSDLDGENNQRLQREAAIMKQRWGSLIADDPAYSPNLTLERDDFSMAWPSRADGWRSLSGS